jgi:hypothetical protein
MNSEAHRIPLTRWIMGGMRDEQNPGLRPILCAPMLRKVDAKLLELLGSLRPEEWYLQTRPRLQIPRPFLRTHDFYEPTVRTLTSSRIGLIVCPGRGVDLKRWRQGALRSLHFEQ